MVTSSYANRNFSLLEEQLRSKLKLARIKRRSNCSEVAGSLVHADAAVVGIALELGMVPCVEGLDAELETTATRFADYEILEQRQVPVVSTGTA